MYKPVVMCNSGPAVDPCDLPPEFEYAAPAICPLVSTTLKKNQIPLYDTCGPFPDETILSGLDRLLYFIGSRRMQALMNWPSPLLDGCSECSDCSINVTPELCPASAGHTSGNIPPPTCNSMSPMRPLTPAINKRCCCCCRKCNIAESTSTPYATPRGSRGSAISRMQLDEIPEIACCSPPPPPPQPPKSSFSLCSLACRKMKQKLSFQTPPGMPANNKCKWLWTRMQCCDNGCEVYEVFKNSRILGQPSQPSPDDGTLPHLIMVVLPNGSIVPFETLTHQ